MKKLHMGKSYCEYAESNVNLYAFHIIISYKYLFSVGQVIKCHEARMINYIFMVVHTKITKVARIRTTVVNKMLTCV